jgi:hypothetical protein
MGIKQISLSILIPKKSTYFNDKMRAPKKKLCWETDNKAPV